MAALTEQQLRELLTEVYDVGFSDGECAACGLEVGDGGKAYVEAKASKPKVIDDLIAKAHVNTMYHGKRGDAAQDYIEQFFRGHRSWDDFRWNEVWDRMRAVAPLDVKGESDA
jgi:hypothetical protein